MLFGSDRLEVAKMPTLRLVILVHAMAGTVACSTYLPAPVTPGAIAAEQHSAQINVRSVQVMLNKIAPDYRWDGAEWNELTLLAAALISNPEIWTAQARLNSFRADIAAARVMPGPTVTLSAEYALNPAESSPWLFGVASDAIIANSGRRNRIRAAEIAWRGAEFDYLDVIWQVRMGLRRALDAYSIAMKEAEIGGELVLMRHRQFDAVSRQTDAGEASRPDLDLVRNDLALAARQKADADTRVLSSRIDIAAALGVPPSSLDWSRLSVAVREMPAAVKIGTEARLAALSARPEILRAMSDYDQAETVLRAAIAAQYPEVSLGPGYTWERGLTKFPLALSLAFPSADFNAAAIRAAQSRRVEAGRRVEAAVADVTNSIDRAALAFDAARARLDNARQQTLPVARAIAAQADRELKLGSIGRGEWAASQAGLASAKLDETAAEQAAFEARALIEEALRRPLDGPELQIGAALAPFDGDVP